MNLAHPILVARSPANVHAMNGCEPQQLRMLYLANRSSMDWTLGSPFAIDLVVSAAEQLNDSVMPFTTNEDVRKQTRYQCFMRGKARSDISRWVAAPHRQL